MSKTIFKQCEEELCEAKEAGEVDPEKAAHLRDHAIRKLFKLIRDKRLLRIARMYAEVRVSY